MKNFNERNKRIEMSQLKIISKYYFNDLGKREWPPLSQTDVKRQLESFELTSYQN